MCAYQKYKKIAAIGLYLVKEYSSSSLAPIVPFHQWNSNIKQLVQFYLPRWDIEINFSTAEFFHRYYENSAKERLAIKYICYLLECMLCVGIHFCKGGTALWWQPSCQCMYSKTWHLEFRYLCITLQFIKGFS